MVRVLTVAMVSGALGTAALVGPRTGHGKSVTPVPATGRVTGPYCSGAYADDFSALSPRAREFDQKPAAQQYTYCIRTTAVYECLSYAGDGNLRRTRKKAVAHGTGFGYRQQNGETLLLTNDHVAEWPVVTDEEHKVDDVPAGCKRVSDNLRIVENEKDTYERDDVALTRVVADPAMDVAILKAHAALPILPWKIGRSRELHERNVIDVRGFPLGAFKATNVGKVVSSHDHDEYKDWDHLDFVVDAQLSPGNSGSPVLGVSCKTGEFELVGIYHAGYAASSPLNVVVAIDQVRDMMTTLKRSPRVRMDGSAALDAGARVKLTEGVKNAIEPFFPFGSLPAVARARGDGALIFEVLGREFPLKSHPVLVMEDLRAKSTGDFGEMGRVWFGNARGLRAFDRADLDPDAIGLLGRILDALRMDGLAALDYRTAAAQASKDREHYESAARLERALRRAGISGSDLSAALLDLAERLSPHGGDSGIPLADAYLVPKPAAPPGAEAGGDREEDTLSAAPLPGTAPAVPPAAPKVPGPRRPDSAAR